MTPDMTKPEPDSRDWWQEVAQGLGVKIHDLKAALTAETQARQQAERERDNARIVNDRYVADNVRLYDQLAASEQAREGLRTALQSIADSSCCGCCQEAALFAKAALRAAGPSLDRK